MPIGYAFYHVHYKHIYTLILSAIAFCFYLHFNYQEPVDNAIIKGVATFELQDCKAAGTAKNPAYYCKAKVKKFTDNTATKRVSKGYYLSFYLKQKKAPKIGHLYSANIEMQKKRKFHYQAFIKSDLNDKGKTSYLPPVRSQLQERIKRFIKKQKIATDSKEVFIALSTGDITPSMTMFYMKQFGLLHLLAISGLHFGLIAYFFTLLLKPIKQSKARNLMLWFILSSYFLFIGVSASVLRAFASISLTIVAYILQLKPRALNILSASLIISLIIAPELIFSIGFQFSYFITFAILLGYHPIERFLKLSLNKLGNYLSIHEGSGILSMASSLMSLSFAVTFASAPLSLYHFHTFPLASIYYNLFFPFLFSFCLYMLITSFLLYPLIPKLGILVLQLNAYYTYYLLQLLEQAPIQHQITIWATSFPFPVLLFSMSSFVLLMLYLEKAMQSPHFSLSFWP
ncbi:MAG: hypothetical protein GWP59_00495 [Chlamydiales bacterium]|nr:ComEC/Rec2 family competence protein [Chlamydiales bacterium]NCF70155.1 hypothetical protein [Chlamydiales bacterium]